MTVPEGTWGMAVAAEMTWQQHQTSGTTWAPGTCARCTSAGCKLYRWAVMVRTGRSAPYPVAPPTPVSLRALPMAA